MTESGSRRRSHEPRSILRGAPASVASSRPIRNETANLPSSVLATGLPLYSRTAHCPPGTPPPRVMSVSLSALVCSQYSVCGSITQTSASVTSRIWLAVRFMMLAKIVVWFSSRKVQNAIAKTRPKYFARSPTSIRSATKFMAPSAYERHFPPGAWRAPAASCRSPRRLCCLPQERGIVPRLPRHEGARRSHHRLRRVLEEEVARLRQLDRGVVRERLFEPLAIGLREAGIPHAPQDQGPAAANAAEAGVDLREVVGCGRDLSGIVGGHAAALEGQEGPQVDVRHVGGQLAPDVVRLRRPSEAVEVHLEELPKRAADELREAPARRTASRHPGPAVADDDPAHELGAAPREAQADGSTPVLHHQGEIAQAQAIDELFEHEALLARRVAVPGGRRRQ